MAARVHVQDARGDQRRKAQLQRRALIIIFECEDLVEKLVGNNIIKLTTYRDHHGQDCHD